MQDQNNFPTTLVCKLTQRDSTEYGGKHAEEHDQPCSLCKLLLNQMILAELLRDMFPKGGDIGVSGSVELDAVHCLDGAHERHLLEEPLRFVDEHDQASKKGNVLVADSGGGESWPELPSSLAREVVLDCNFCRRGA